MISSASTTSIILAILYFVAAGIALGFTTYYVDENGNALEASLLTVAEQQQHEQKFNELERLVNDTVEERQTLRTFFFAEEDTIGLLADLEQKAAARGLQFETSRLDLAEPEDDARFQILTLDWEVLGVEPRVVSFVELLETLPYYSRTTSITLREASGADVPANAMEANGTLELLLPIYDE